MRITIYHNPACGTSRNVLGLIRNSGEEPQIIEYLKTPPNRDELVRLLKLTGLSPRQLVRTKNAPELKLDAPEWTDDRLIELMVTRPALINRPIVITPLGARLCRPSEAVLDILPERQRGAFAKEDGEKIVDEKGNQLA
jgi:arsenate reductase